MFTKKQTIEANPVINSRVHSDLIVHNMPSPSRLKGSVSRSATMSLNFSSGQPSKPANNSKLLGLVIIIGGFIFIGILIYLSYRFIIYPSSTTSLSSSQTGPATSTPAADQTPAATPVNNLSATSSLDLSSLAPQALDAATSTIPTSSDLLNATASAPVILDSDNDGLNDEEEAVLGTSATLADSDKDAYSDLAELTSGHNPIGSGTLKDEVNLTVYNNKSLLYSLVYPKIWPVKSLNDGNTIIFNTPDESLIQVSVQDNTNKASILSWYQESFPNVTLSYDKLKNSDSWEGIMGEDGLNFYLTDKKRNNIWVFSYIPAVEQRVAYPNIFKMMINSLVISSK